MSRSFPHLLALALLALAPAAHAQSSSTDQAYTQPPFGGEAADLRLAFQRSCAQFALKPASQPLAAGTQTGNLPSAVFGTYGQWQSICKEALAQPPAKLEQYFAKRFVTLEPSAADLAAITPAEGTAPTSPAATPAPKFTGYYKPVLQGSRTRHGEYQTPLLKLPADFVTHCPDGRTGQKLPDGSCHSPYLTRAAIDQGLDDGLTNGTYKSILWLKDPVDAYFLQIQGSGVVELDEKDPNGAPKLAYVGFAGKNGYPYVAIGKTLRQRGVISGSVTADKIRSWLASATPASATEVYESNPSYIFFREFPNDSPGAFGVPLVPGRSLAVDHKHMPFGIPVLIETHLTHDDQPWRRIMFAHDVGSAINGPARGDIFFGLGPEAAARAGDQNAPGHLYLLVPKENVTRLNLTPSPVLIAPLVPASTPAS